MSVKIFALLCSVGVSLLAGEMCLRVVLDPVDFLMPARLPDPILGLVISPGSGGHDALGFRNPEVPEKIDVVTLGDSMTYGYAAPMREAWPSWYAQIAARSVYNLGIGGYGPAEYAHLLESRALDLEPDLVILGLYFGNDLHNAYQAVETRDHWTELKLSDEAWRAYGRASNDGDAAPEPTPLQLRDRGLRHWLRSHSMIFRLFETSPVGVLVNAIGDRQNSGERGGCQLDLSSPFPTVMKLDERIIGVDLQSAEVRRGLDLSLLFIDRMIDLTRERGIDFAVLLLPSKERVLAPLASPVPAECQAVLDAFVASEVEASGAIRARLASRGVPVIEPLEALTTTARERRIYPRSGDTHPLGVGYRLIAEEVARVLDAPGGEGEAATH